MGDIYTKDICQKWKKHPLQNPFNGKTLKISKTGIYAKLDKNCKNKNELKVNIKKKPSIVITTKECVQFMKDPSINPITKRKLDIKAINGIYAKLLKECDKNAINNIQIIRARNAIRKSLKPVLNRMESIENRIEFSNIVKQYTVNVESCLTKSDTNSKVLTLMEKTNEGIVKELIRYDKRIGSESVYGIAYANVGQKLFKMITFSSKILPVKGASLEIELLQKMSTLAENKKSPHMPIIYRILRCDKPYDFIMKEQGISTYETPNKLILKGSYYIVMNELATYDLAHFLKTGHTLEVYESVLMQVALSLHTFHKYTKYLHNDAHWGNFLIHKIKEGGHWHYKLNDVDVYVPNMGFLVVLWDPGLAKMINSNMNYGPAIDFDRIYNVISNERFYDSLKLVKIPRDALKPFLEMRDYISNEKDYINAFVKFFKKSEQKVGFMDFFQKTKKPKSNFKTILIDPLEEPKKIINPEAYLL